MTVIGSSATYAGKKPTIRRATYRRGHRPTVMLSLWGKRPGPGADPAGRSGPQVSREHKGAQMTAIAGTSDGPGVPGVRGDGKTDNDGVQGFATHPDHVGVLGVGGGAGVKGDCPNGDGVQGFTNSPIRAGVIGINQTSGVGVKGVSEGHDAIQGFAKHPDHVGVLGVGGGAGVKGDCPNGDGVQGFTQDGNRSGVVGTNTSTGAGVLGQCKNGVGVHAVSTNGTGLVASGAKAGFFDGNVEVKGQISCPTIDSLLSRISQLEQKIQSAQNVEQKVQALQNQLNTAVSNLTARVTNVEVRVSGLQAISHTHG